MSMAFLNKFSAAPSQPSQALFYNKIRHNISRAHNGSGWPVLPSLLFHPCWIRAYRHQKTTGEPSLKRYR